ncbi:hypothetical protein FP432_02850 [Lactobacillus sp. PV034]|nr:hypothetical protein FP432_02850 [Lactobacillus sp. PV034]
MLFGTFLGLSACSSTNSTSNQEHIEVKKVGTKRLASAKAKKDTLTREKKDKEKEYQKLQDQLNDQKQQEEQQKQAQEEQKQQRENNTSSSVDTTTSTTQHGDLDTSNSQKIIGNSHSHIYHVPGQAGYRMNSANVVYFNSEQEAIAAGYRKAKR